jgi:hypothetical protein|mmetsp:Transcript_87688/g.145735  ORF Transcript_87688/g.145735 Transcript_87688/m.145735 type:complete len:99 (-) Transcript_87688:1707-2003(-)
MENRQIKMHNWKLLMHIVSSSLLHPHQLLSRHIPPDVPEDLEKKFAPKDLEKNFAALRASMYGPFRMIKKYKYPLTTAKGASGTAGQPSSQVLQFCVQ